MGNRGFMDVLREVRPTPPDEVPLHELMWDDDWNGKADIRADRP